MQSNDAPLSQANLAWDALLELDAVGSFYQALLSGVLVQWLVDPKRAPSARDLADALSTIIANANPVEKPAWAITPAPRSS